MTVPTPGKDSGTVNPTHRKEWSVTEHNTHQDAELAAGPGAGMVDLSPWQVYVDGRRVRYASAGLYLVLGSWFRGADPVQAAEELNDVFNGAWLEIGDEKTPMMWSALMELGRSTGILICASTSPDGIVAHLEEERVYQGPF